MEYEENVEWTARMAELAHGAGAAVEAELGKLAGEEDGLSVPEVEAKMTDPKQVGWDGTPHSPHVFEGTRCAAICVFVDGIS